MGRDRIILCHDEMVEFGKSMGSQITPGIVLALSGDLGAGKTTFVQGLAQSLGVKDPIQSPTFVYMNSYVGSLPLYHFDLYRMKGEDDFLGLGFDEYFVSDGVCVIEWPERIFRLLPSNTIHLSFSHLGIHRRVHETHP